MLNALYAIICKMFWKVTCQKLKTLVSFPDPTLRTLKHFLGLVHHHVTARAPDNHMIAELAETKSAPISPDTFLACMVGSGNETIKT